MKYLTVDIRIAGRRYDRVHVHGAGGVLTDNAHNLGRLRAWLADPRRHRVLRVYTSITAEASEYRDVATECVTLIAVHGDAACSEACCQEGP